MIEYDSFQSQVGSISILAVNEGVIKIAFEKESKEAIDCWCWEKLSMRFQKGTKLTDEPKNKILSFLSGKIKYLDFPILHFNSPFYKKVLEAEKKIPYGKTKSYQEIANMINHPKSVRAVGSANANNPLPIYFPCHRIINSNGNIGGYGGGIEIKRKLLHLEYLG
tara:strand:- start:48 stop:542 length:495 start_codon:yes stop_codon:yes gene_type:complete